MNSIRFVKMLNSSKSSALGSLDAFAIVCFRILSMRTLPYSNFSVFSRSSLFSDYSSNTNFCRRSALTSSSLYAFLIPSLEYLLFDSLTYLETGDWFSIVTSISAFIRSCMSTVSVAFPLILRDAYPLFSLTCFSRFLSSSSVTFREDSSRTI
jgi:hypothetical protein